MANQITGKIIKILPQQTSNGKNGTWTKQEFVVETMDQYPKKVCISTWGNLTANMDSYSVGDKVIVNYNAESREYNDKWFTELRAWKINKEDGSKEAMTKEYSESEVLSDSSDDLPF